jgi:hypothetical protein
VWKIFVFAGLVKGVALVLALQIRENKEKTELRS